MCVCLYAHSGAHVCIHKCIHICIHPQTHFICALSVRSLSLLDVKKIYSFHKVLIMNAFAEVILSNKETENVTALLRM